MVADISERIKSQLPVRVGNLSLRIFEETDITDQYISWLNDPEVVRYSNQRFLEHDKESCQIYFDSMKSASALFILIEHDLEGSVGTMSIHVNTNHSTADIGILIGQRSIWGKGVGQGAWKAVLRLLEDSGYIRKITAGTLSCNEGMKRLALRSGMIEEGRRRKQEIVDGEACDIIYFCRFCNE